MAHPASELARAYRKPMTQRVATWVAATFLFLVSLASASAGPRRVLFLHSFGPNFSPYSEFAAKLREDLPRQTSERIDLYEVSVASARFAEGEQEGPLVEYVNSLFVGRPPDLLITIGAPATAFLQRQRQRVFPSVPALFAAVDQRRVKAAALGGQRHCGCCQD
jgi:hypothetical protein